MKQQVKQTIVQAGPYEGKEAIIQGKVEDLYGCSVFGLAHKDSDVLNDYMKRLVMEPVSTLSKVFIATVDGKTVALNEYEISGTEGK
jgi:hypothetical protein